MLWSSVGTNCSVQCQWFWKESLAFPYAPLFVKGSDTHTYISLQTWPWSILVSLLKSHFFGKRNHESLRFIGFFCRVFVSGWLEGALGGRNSLDSRRFNVLLEKEELCRRGWRQAAPGRWSRLAGGSSATSRVCPVLDPVADGVGPATVRSRTDRQPVGPHFGAYSGQLWRLPRPNVLASSSPALDKHMELSA